MGFEHECAKEMAKMSLNALLMLNELLENVILQNMQDDRLKIQEDSIGSVHVIMPDDMNQEFIDKIIAQKHIAVTHDDNGNMMISESDIPILFECYRKLKEDEIKKQKNILDELDISYKENEYSNGVIVKENALNGQPPVMYNLPGLCIREADRDKLPDDIGQIHLLSEDDFFHFDEYRQKMKNRSMQEAEQRTTKAVTEANQELIAQGKLTESELFTGNKAAVVYSQNYYLEREKKEEYQEQDIYFTNDAQEFQTLKEQILGRQEEEIIAIEEYPEQDITLKEYLEQETEQDEEGLELEITQDEEELETEPEIQEQDKENPESEILQDEESSELEISQDKKNPEIEAFHDETVQQESEFKEDDHKQYEDSEQDIELGREIELQQDEAEDSLQEESEITKEEDDEQQQDLWLKDSDSEENNNLEKEIETAREQEGIQETDTISELKIEKTEDFSVTENEEIITETQKETEQKNIEDSYKKQDDFSETISVTEHEKSDTGEQISASKTFLQKEDVQIPSSVFTNKDEQIKSEMPITNTDKTDKSNDTDFHYIQDSEKHYASQDISSTNSGFNRPSVKETASESVNDKQKIKPDSFSTENHSINTDKSSGYQTEQQRKSEFHKSEQKEQKQIKENTEQDKKQNSQHFGYSTNKVSSEQNASRTKTESVKHAASHKAEQTSIDGKKYEAGAKFVSSPVAYIKQQLKEGGSEAKGIAEIATAKKMADSVMKSKLVLAHVSTEKDHLKEMFDSSTAIQQYFLTLNYKGDYNYDEINKCLKESFKGKNVSSERLTIGMETRSMFKRVAGDSKGPLTMKQIRKHPENFVLTKKGIDFFKTENVKDAAEIAKFMTRTDMTKSIEIKARKNTLFSNANRKIRQKTKEGGSETTDGFYQVSDMNKARKLTQQMSAKIHDKKFELKRKIYQDQMIHYQKRINKITEENIKLSKSVNKNKEKLAQDYMDILQKKRQKSELKKNAASAKIEARKAKQKLKEDKKEAKKLKNVLKRKEQRKLQKMEDLIAKSTKKGNVALTDKLKKKLKKQKEKAAKRAATSAKAAKLLSTVKNTKIFAGLTKFAAFGSKIAAAAGKVLVACAKVILVIIAFMFAIYYWLLIIMDVMALLYMNPFASVTTSYSSSGNTSSSISSSATVSNPYQSTFKALEAAEKNWVEDIWNFTNKDDVSLLDYEDEIDWQEALQGTPYTYNNGVITWQPLGVGETVKIQKVNGNVAADFVNLNDATRKSNLKDILCMSSVYYDFSSESPDALEHINQENMDALKQIWANPSSTIEYKGFKGLWNKLFNKNKTNPIGEVLYSDDKDTVLLGSYALTAFQASHDIDIAYDGIKVYPIYVNVSDEVKAYAQSTGNLSSDGELIVCPEKYGCYQLPEKVYFQSGMVTCNGQVIPRSAVYIKDKDCSTLSEDEQKRSPCWVRVIDHYETEKVTDQFGTHIVKNPVYRYDHDCRGHKANICAGHVSIRVTGYIHSFKEEETHLIQDDLDGTAYKLTGEKESDSVNTDTFHDSPEIDYDSIDHKDDIFKADTEANHVYVPYGWTGWTEYNKRSALTRYEGDWGELYNMPEVENRDESDIFTRKTSSRIFSDNAFNSSNFDSSTFDNMSDVEIVGKIISSHEGNYASINGHDNGAISIGKIQWHGNRALELVRRIVNKDPATAKSLLGNALYNEVMNSSTSWATRYMDDGANIPCPKYPNKHTTRSKRSDECNRLQSLLNTEASKEAQDELYNQDVAGYMATAASHGITDIATQAFLADIINQYGSLCPHAYQEIVKRGGTLDDAFNLLVTEHYVCPTCNRRWDQYEARRRAVYEQCKAAFGNRTSNVAKDKSGYIFVGDSRTVGMQTAIGESDTIKFVGQVGAGFDYVATARAEVAKIQNENPNTEWHIIYNFGVNDLYNANKYAELYKELNNEYEHFYVMSVNPVIENGTHSATTADIQNFNRIMSSQGFHYINTYAKIVNSFDSPDGLHYSTNTYKKIYNVIVSQIPLGKDSVQVEDDKTNISGATTITTGAVHNYNNIRVQDISITIPGYNGTASFVCASDLHIIKDTSAEWDARNASFGGADRQTYLTDIMTYAKTKNVTLFLCGDIVDNATVNNYNAYKEAYNTSGINNVVYIRADHDQLSDLTNKLGGGTPTSGSLPGTFTGTKTVDINGLKIVCLADSVSEIGVNAKSVIDEKNPYLILTHVPFNVGDTSSYTSSLHGSIYNWASGGKYNLDNALNMNSWQTALINQDNVGASIGGHTHQDTHITTTGNASQLIMAPAYTGQIYHVTVKGK